MDLIRRELSPGVYLNCTQASKFKTGLLSAQLVTPLSRERAAAGALLPAVLHRGTARCPDMNALSRALDLLYGAGLSFTVRKKGENHCLGFVMSFIDDAYAPGGEKLLEESAELLGEMLLSPALEGGLFRESYVEGEKNNLIDAIRSIIDDKRDYADMRLLSEMCREERYGVPKLGDEEGVRALDSEGLFRYYQELLATARLELFYCGSAPFERAEAALNRSLAALPHGERVEPVTAVHRPAPAEPRFITQSMSVTQGKLAMGFRTDTEDSAAMLLANLIFGGYSNSKLFLNVREKLSLCYYASSIYHRSKNLVTVSSGVEFGNFERARDEILAQLAALSRGEMEDWELSGAKGVLISALRSREDSAARMEENLIGQAATGIWETAEELIEKVEGVTAERVAAAAASVKQDTVYFLTGEEEATA